MLHKITPYPWKVQILNYSHYIKSCKAGIPMVGREGTVRAQGRSLEEHQNNANLMAAGPELLLALHGLVGCSELNMDDMEPETREAINYALNTMHKYNLNKLLWEPEENE